MPSAATAPPEHSEGAVAASAEPGAWNRYEFSTSVAVSGLSGLVNAETSVMFAAGPAATDGESM